MCDWIKGHILRLITLVLLAPSAVLAQTPPAPSTDNELWLDQNLSLGLSPRTKLELSTVQRLDRGASNLFEAFWEAGLDVRVRPWLSVMPAFRHIRNEPFRTEARYENRMMLNVTAGIRRGRWRPDLRMRLEGRFTEDRAARLRIRLRPRVQYTLPVGGARQPVLGVHNEFFLDAHTGSYVRNRVQAGVELPLAQHFSVRPYYMLESNRIAVGWDHDNVWGLSLRWSY